MSRIITRGLRWQLELKAPQNVLEVVQLQEQKRFQVKGIQPIDASSIEPQ
jgi:hypothetical protein